MLIKLLAKNKNYWQISKTSLFPISKKTEQINRNRKFLAQRKSTAKAVQMASQIGFEPTAFRLGGEPSIQLRYWDTVTIYNLKTTI